MTEKELERHKVLTQLIDNTIDGKTASKKLSISVRHVRRLRRKVEKGGAKALTHGNRGKVSNRCIKPEIMQKALSLIKEKYHDFKPTFATEKLEEVHGITLSSETLRNAMTRAGLWKPRTRKMNRQYHVWRPRKEQHGEMSQFDGSYHHWFEDRNGEICLLAAIDDATGEPTLKFAKNEGVEEVSKFWKEYIIEKGKPSGIYLDKYSTYKINHKSAVDNSNLMTQFQRMMHEVGVELIIAHSPQAKGRVERLFGTLQDRLVKELRLRNISDTKTANIFLKEEFTPNFCEKFCVIPTKKGDVHRKISVAEYDRFPSIFSIQNTRKVNNDFTVRFKNMWLQLTLVQPLTVLRKDTVIMEERLDGTLHMRLRDKYLDYTKLPGKPEKVTVKLPALTQVKACKPKANHPWRGDSFWRKQRVEAKLREAATKH